LNYDGLYVPVKHLTRGYWVGITERKGDWGVRVQIGVKKL